MSDERIVKKDINCEEKMLEGLVTRGSERCVFLEMRQTVQEAVSKAGVRNK